MSNELQQELPGSLFLYSNAFNIAMDMIENAASFGMYFIFTLQSLNLITNKETEKDINIYDINQYT